MSEAVHSKGLGDEIRELKRRLDELERVSRLSRSSLKEGVVTVLDGDGNERILLGKLADGTYGFRLLDPSGNELVRIGEVDDSPERFGVLVKDEDGHVWLQAGTGGLLDPSQVGQTRDPNNGFVNVTSAVFASQYRTVFPEIKSNAIVIYIPWATAAATTGEVRLVAGGGNTTSAFSVPAGSSGLKAIAFIPGNTGPVVDLEARRTSGVGNVSIYQPYGFTEPGDGFTSSGTAFDF